MRRLSVILCAVVLVSLACTAPALARGLAPTGVTILDIDGNADIPGGLLPGLTFNDSLDQNTDADDVWGLSLDVGDHLTLAVDSDPDAEVTLYLYSPSATSIAVSTPIATAASGDFPRTIEYVAEEAGLFFFRVGIYSGSADYSISIDTANDNEFPGAPLYAANPMQGSLDQYEDAQDIYSVTLGSGDHLVASINADPDMEFWLDLYAPGSSSIHVDDVIATSDASRTLKYRVVDPGTYSLCTRLYSGGANYSISWNVENDDDIPGLSGFTSPVSDSFDQFTDTDDVYKVHLVAGTRLHAQIDSAPDSDVGLYLYDPEAVSVFLDAPVAGLGANQRSIDYTVPVTGDYYLDAWLYSGEANYTLSWTVATTGTLSGKVQSAGVAVAGASVSVAGGGSTTMAADGSYTISGLAPGTRSVTYSKAGYRPQTANLSISAGLTTTNNVSLALTAGTVSGKVTDAGVGVAGVAVILSNAGATTTLADGSYSISGVPVGTYSAVFGKAGYATKTVPVTVTDAATTVANTELTRIVTKASIAKKPAGSSVTYKRKAGAAKFKLSATFKGWGATPLVGRTVYLQTSKNGKTGWKNTYKLKTSSKGVASKSFKVKSAKTVYYRWSIGAKADWNTATKSSKTKVRVK